MSGAGCGDGELDGAYPSRSYLPWHPTELVAVFYPTMSAKICPKTGS
jgi:hypothetical protein